MIATVTHFAAWGMYASFWVYERASTPAAIHISRDPLVSSSHPGRTANRSSGEGWRDGAAANWGAVGVPRVSRGAAAGSTEGGLVDWLRSANVSSRDDAPTDVKWEQPGVEDSHDASVLFAAGVHSLTHDLDPRQAMVHFHAAGKLGMGGAQYWVGVLMERGSGCERDVKKAFKWFRKAARLGHPGAMREVSDMLMKGEVVKRDLVKAKQWSVRAHTADGGYVSVQDSEMRAALHVTSMLGSGPGVRSWVGRVGLMPAAAIALKGMVVAT